MKQPELVHQLQTEGVETTARFMSLRIVGEREGTNVTKGAFVLYKSTCLTTTFHVSATQGTFEEPRARCM
jgi:hypothetical protein